MRAVTDARRRVLWTGTDGPRAEACEIGLSADGLQASGIQIGLAPAPYRLDYSLDTAESFVTRTLDVTASGAGWQRQLRLERDDEDRWNVDDADELDEALDCDLRFSPLTNLMPVRRHGLHLGPGTAEIVVAWVSVPDLAVHASRQRYEHVRLTDDGAVVRFIDLELYKGFTSELELDRDGLVVAYPDLAGRVR